MRRKQEDNLLTIWETLLLAIGAAGGLCWVAFVWVDRARLSLLDLRTWVVLFYGALSGLTLAGTCYLAAYGIAKRRRLRFGAFAWFVLGVNSWIFLPIVIFAVERFMPGLRSIPLAGFLPLRGETAPAQLAEAMFINVVPLFSLTLLIAGAIAGRPVRQWWKCRGWWPEWFGMYILVVWSLLGVQVIVKTYLRL